MTSKEQLISEVEALYKYINRDTYNLNVALTMLYEILLMLEENETH